MISLVWSPYPPTLFLPRHSDDKTQPVHLFRGGQGAPGTAVGSVATNRNPRPVNRGQHLENMWVGFLQGTPPHNNSLNTYLSSFPYSHLAVPPTDMDHVPEEDYGGDFYSFRVTSGDTDRPPRDTSCHALQGIRVQGDACADSTSCSFVKVNIGYINPLDHPVTMTDVQPDSGLKCPGT